MSTPILDPSVYEDLSEGMGDEFAAELVTTFLDEAPVMLAELKTAAEQGDTDTYRRAAHSIKSNGEVFGAVRLTKQAREMELGGLSDPIAQVAALNAVYDATAHALRGLLNA